MPDYVTPNALGLAQDELARQLTAMSVSGLQQYQGKLRTVLIGGIPHAWQPNPPAEGPPGYPAHTSIGGYWVPRPGPSAPGSGGVSEERVAEIEAARPVYSITAQGTAQAAIDATPVGVETDLRAGATLTTPLVLTGEKGAIGGASGAVGAKPLKAGAGHNGPTVIIRPPADGFAREGARYTDWDVENTSGTGEAVYVDLTGNRRLSSVTFDNFHLRATGGHYAMTVANEPSQADAFFTSRFLGGHYSGGLYVNGGGDSIAIRDAKFSGDNESIRVNLITEPQTDGNTGDSSQLLIDGVNCTGKKGIRIEHGPRPRIVNSNLECYGAGTNNALIALLGAPGDPIRDATITGNLIAAAPHALYGVYCGVTDGVTIGNNTIAAPGGMAGHANVFISADAKNTVLLGNITEGHPVIDNGVGTMGLHKPLPRGAGVTPAPNRTAPQFIKMVDGLGGVVSLSGSVSCPNAPDTLIGTLPPGFRPLVQDVYSAFVYTGATYLPAYLYVDVGGNVALAAAVPELGTLADLSLRGVQFWCPRV